MEITIDKSLLQDVFGRVAKVVEQKSVSPVAGTVKMEVSADKLSFVGRGNEMFVTVTVDSSKFKLEDTEDAKDGFSVCIPANTLVQLLPKLPNYLNGIIRLSVSKNDNGVKLAILPPKTEVKKSESRYDMDALDGEEFFDMPKVDLQNEIKIKSRELLGIINKVPVASGGEHYRLFYMATRFCIEDNKLLVASTDGSRLAELILQADNLKDNEFMCFANSLVYLKTIFNFGEETEDIKIICGESHIQFSQEDKIVYVGRIKTDFPNYQNNIPDKFTAELEVETSAFLEYLGPTLLLSDVKVVLSFTKNGIEISGEDSKTSSKDVIDIVKWIAGDEVRDQVFSGEFLIEQLRVFDEQVITLKLVGPGQPMQLCGDKYMQLLSALQAKSKDDDSE